MKNKMKVIVYLLSLMMLLGYDLLSLADPPGAPDPPLPPGSHGGEGQVSAPIDGGLGIVLLLSAGYGVLKVRKARKSKDSDC
jgi:hypothetical protein